MARYDVREYHIGAELPGTEPGTKDCHFFCERVETIMRIALEKRTLEFNVSGVTHCNFYSDFNSYTTGKRSINRIKKYLETEFPNIVFTQFRRKRKN